MSGLSPVKRRSTSPEDYLSAHPKGIRKDPNRAAAVSAITLARLPEDRGPEAPAAREECRRWVAAAQGDGGALWQLLHDFTEDALTCGLRHHAYNNRVKNALRFRLFLHAHRAGSCGGRPGASGGRGDHVALSSWTR